MRIFIKIILLLAACACINLTAIAATPVTTPSPIKTLQEASDETIFMINKTRKELQVKHKLRADESLPFPNTVKIIEDILIPQFDLVYVAKTILGPTVWQKATPSQQKHFIIAFKTLLINTYGTALTNYRGEEIQFFNIRGGYAGLEKVQVKSKILQKDGPGIAVDYLMLLDKISHQWRVIDISIEGVSLLENFRSQFATDLKQGGIKQLLTTLDKHNLTVARQNTPAKNAKQKTS